MLPILDEADALDRVGDDRELLRMLLDAFAVQIPQDTEEIQAALAARNAKQLADVAHRMKGAVSTLGGKECQELAFVVEQRARALALNQPDSTWDGLDQDVQNLLAGLARLQPELDRLGS